jgi:mRNA interferase RelE/StbE
MSYSIQFRRSARKELENLQHDIAERIVHAILHLADDPRPQGCKKLQTAQDLWRIRIGDYRVVYQIDDQGRIIIVEVIAHRRDAYRP